MEWFLLISIFVVSTVLSSLLIPVMKKVAFRYDVLDHPGYHKTHTNVHPLLGGGAIFGSFLTIILAGVGFLGLAKLGVFSVFPELQRHLLIKFHIADLYAWLDG
jgi:UDP-N-acetylmuramyl pentapeptide phosphotransferase/UDP-N-acetylglucosamine-1-phosphate transferase